LFPNNLVFGFKTVLDILSNDYLMIMTMCYYGSQNDVQ
jgi:hypothetical protein